ncbi:BTAD domain-containing putative transcriptional regulator [Sphaerisporangium sp. B11E5]|uniref:AfsR/SARP family transcriptional regulator n=1 Tax=Sphaerisporangium sp. B11E5 TaxID=3153563 RepID=UPI00325C7FA4
MRAGVRVHLLGGVGAVTRDGEPLDVGPAKCQALLAALALSPGSAVPVWRLVESLWGEAPPRTAGRTLQSYVTRLRRALGPGSITRTGDAYRLDVDGDAVDAVRFQRLADAGDAGAALAEWTGHPLAGLTAPGLAAAVDGMVERWSSLVEADLEHRVATAPAAAVGPLTELTSRHPYREGFWALLMTALYRTGRQADALAAYRTARRTLVEHLGVEPGPRLRELEASVLGQSLAVRPGTSPLPDGGPAVRSGTAPSPGGRPRRDAGNLPSRPGRLFGRDGDVGAVVRALDGHPVVTLVGPGGIGKTRLAVAVARRAAPADGAWLVDLAQIAHPGDVARAVAGTLGVTEGAEGTVSVVTALRSRRVLLVLDNCEHVIDGAAALAQAVAEGCPDVRLLTTSREGLGLAHGLERLLTVGPLDPSGAGADLFTDRASAFSPAFADEATRPEIEEICRRLDGIPLAIELAATRTATRTVADLLNDDHLRVLADGPRTAAARHRTLRATIQWSYDLLVPAERLLFQHLSVFTGPFDLPAVRAVAPGADLTLDGLVRRSMVVAETGPLGRRFRLLETMRHFAAEALTASGRAGVTTGRHTRWCLSEAARIRHLLAGPSEPEGVVRLDELWPNLRTAVHRALAANDAHLAHALVAPVAGEIALRGRTEIGHWAEQILALAPHDEDLRVPALTWAAQRYKLTRDPAAYDRLTARHGEPGHPVLHHARAALSDDHPALVKWAPQAAAHLRRHGEHDLADRVDLDAAAAEVFRGNLAEGGALLTALIDRLSPHGPPTLLNWATMMLGYCASFQGDHLRAGHLFHEASLIELPPGTFTPSRPIEARTAFRRGDHVSAFAILRTHIEELLGTDNMYGTCVASIEFVTMTATTGHLPEATHILRYIRSTGMLDSPVWPTQLPEALRTIDLPATETPPLDHRQALEYMRSVVRDLP